MYFMLKMTFVGHDKRDPTVYACINNGCWIWRAWTAGRYSVKSGSNEQDEINRIFDFERIAIWNWFKYKLQVAFIDRTIPSTTLRHPFLSPLDHPQCVKRRGCLPLLSLRDGTLLMINMWFDTVFIVPVDSQTDVILIITLLSILQIGSAFSRSELYFRNDPVRDNLCRERRPYKRYAQNWFSLKQGFRMFLEQCQVWNRGNTQLRPLCRRCKLSCVKEKHETGKRASIWKL